MNKTRYGVRWSIDGKRWLELVKGKTIEEGWEQFKANTAPYKEFIKHEIEIEVLQTQTP